MSPGRPSLDLFQKASAASAVACTATVSSGIIREVAETRMITSTSVTVVISSADTVAIFRTLRSSLAFAADLIAPVFGATSFTGEGESDEP